MVAGRLSLGLGTPPSPSLGTGTLYFDSADDQLYIIDGAGATVGPITSGGGGGTGVVASNVLYVQTPANGGDDATGTRGDSTKPFSNIGPALAAANNGDVILVGTGLFEAPVQISNWNATLLDITIIGSGCDNTIIAAPFTPFPAAAFTFNYVADLVIWQRFVLRSCSLRASSSGTNVIVSNEFGRNALSYFPEPGPASLTGFYLYDVNVTVSGPGTITNIGLNGFGYVRLERVTVPNELSADVSINAYNCATAILRDCAFSTLFLDHNFADIYAPSPSSTRGAFVERCSLRTLRVDGQVRARVIDCTITQNLGPLSPLTVGPGSEVINFVMRGGSVETVDFNTNPLPDVAPPALPFLQFHGVQIAAAAFSVAAPSANRFPVLLTGCAIRLTLFAGDGVDVSAKSSTFSRPLDGNVTTSPLPLGGTVAPPLFVTGSFPVAAPPFPTVITLPFNLPNTSFIALADYDNIGSGPFATVLRAQDEVQMTATAGGGNVRALIALFA